MEKNLAKLITPEIQSTDIPLSSAFLEELDDYMISLIHDNADIDTDFYGMCRYRCLSLVENQSAENAD